VTITRGDLEVAKDKLTDSLSTAVDAALEASAPVRAEAASRASDALSTASDALGTLKRSPKRSRGKRLGLFAAIGGAAVAAFALIRGRSKASPPVSYPAPAPTPPPPPSEAPVAEASADAPTKKSTTK
jgi:hypothetical protein